MQVPFDIFSWILPLLHNRKLTELNLSYCSINNEQLSFFSVIEVDSVFFWENPFTSTNEIFRIFSKSRIINIIGNLLEPINPSLYSAHPIEKLLFVDHFSYYDNDCHRHEIDNNFWSVLSSISHLQNLTSLHLKYPFSDDVFKCTWEHRLIATLLNLQYLNGSLIDKKLRAIATESYLSVYANEVEYDLHPTLLSLKSSRRM